MKAMQPDKLMAMRAPVVWLVLPLLERLVKAMQPDKLVVLRVLVVWLVLQQAALPTLTLPAM